MVTRVLVVEDEDDTREILVECLLSEGYSVKGASSGAEAISLASEHQYDVILSDLGLPGCDGWTVARLVHLAQPKARIYLLTGWAKMIASDVAASMPEVLGIYAKPYSLDLVLDLVAGREPKAAYG